MEFDKIIAISGQGSLFAIASRTSFGLVAESLEDGKKIPVYAHYTVSKLEDISIYTEDGDVLLREVMLKVFEKHGGKEVGALKDNDAHKVFFEEVLPNYDKDKVYISDIKKLVKWYNQLVRKDLLNTEMLTAKKDTQETTEVGEEKPEKEKKEAKPKTTVKAKAKTNTAVKNAPAKKVQTVRKSGGS